MRKRIESNLLLCRALGHSPVSKRREHNYFCCRHSPTYEQPHMFPVTHLGQCWTSPRVVGLVWWAFWAGSGPCSVWSGRGEGTACGDTHMQTYELITLLPTYIGPHMFTHAPYSLISSTLKLGWHHESSSVTSCCSRWLWPVTKDSANGNLFCRISGTHICRGRVEMTILEVG